MIGQTNKQTDRDKQIQNFAVIYKKKIKHYENIQKEQNKMTNSVVLSITKQERREQELVIPEILSNYSAKNGYPQALVYCYSAIRL